MSAAPQLLCPTCEGPTVPAQFLSGIKQRQRQNLQAADRLHEISAGLSFTTAMLSWFLSDPVNGQSMSASTVEDLAAMLRIFEGYGKHGFAAPETQAERG